MGPGTDINAFDSAVSDIYEAALNPANWDVALTSMTSYFAPPHSDVSMLLWERIEPPAGRFIGASGVNDFARQGYLSFFAGKTPWSIAGHDMAIGSVAHSDQIVPRTVFRESQFYNDFLKNWEIEVAILASIDRIGTDHLGLCFAGPDMHDLSDLEANVRRLVPHIQRATRISRRIGEVDLRAANAEAMLDQSPSAIFCIGASMELLFANASAHKAMSLHGVFSEQGGTLRATTQGMQQKLMDLLQASLAPKSVHTERTASLRFECGDGPEFRAIAMLVEPGINDHLASGINGMKIMIVGGPQHEVPVEAMEHLRSWFDLTAAEARLAAWLTTGGSLEDFTTMRGVSVNAGRFLLKGIFSKTGVKRQTELLALLYETPFAWSRKESLDTLPR